VWKYFCDYYPISLVKVKKKKSPVWQWQLTLEPNFDPCVSK
jgi:hypothetical protein